MIRAFHPFCVLIHFEFVYSIYYHEEWFSEVKTCRLSPNINLQPLLPSADQRKYCWSRWLPLFWLASTNPSKSVKGRVVSIVHCVTLYETWATDLILPMVRLYSWICWMISSSNLSVMVSKSANVSICRKTAKKSAVVNVLQCTVRVICYLPQQLPSRDVPGFFQTWGSRASILEVLTQ